MISPRFDTSSGWSPVVRKCPQLSECFGDWAYHLGMVRIDSAIPADRKEAANALVRGVPEEEDDQEEEEQGDDDEEGEEDKTEGEGSSE